MEPMQGVVPAVRKIKDFEKLLKSDHKIIILLETRIALLANLVKYAKQFDKQIIVHLDLINGLKVDQYGMELLVHHMKVDGVISTRGNIISMAKKNGLVAIQRMFAIDSSAIRKNIELVDKTKPDYIEVLPGIIHPIIQEIAEQTETPVIAGGLIRSTEDIELALNHGAVAITTSRKELWNYNSAIRKFKINN
ncbi:glycerol-3-phosphate responsive antiterminator [Virgibacillus sp. YIM 98842]|uniref:glycerol-3-phosphate responsive antiterminator n=1 Tax=Virgibacillus sp. YIM 98842 TaxID=2663533 RepID=UPI0013DC55F3|nr:glycerol-3-phosphate responsive antiterminator [Virgibacillus sp. YIM 98842]